jgi:putative ABC transport system substrate-binding protein
VASLARPGGNLTGNSILEFDLALKRLQLVKEIAPNASRVGLLDVPGTMAGAAAVAESGARDIDNAAGSLGMHVMRLGIREPKDLASALATMAKERIDALIVRLDAMLAAHYGEIGQLAVQHRLPTIGGASQFVAAGDSSPMAWMSTRRTDVLQCLSTRFSEAPSRLTSRSNSRPNT